jgi:hypothetical protein
MNDEYLWDGTGEPDPEMQKLETTLGRFRHQDQPPDFSQVVIAPRQTFWQKFSISRLSLALAAATAAVLLISIYGVIRWNQNHNAASGSGWDVQSLTGTIRVESTDSGKKTASTKLAAGQILITDSHSKANISVSDIGTVSVEPNTRLRLEVGGNGHNHLALDVGTIHAFIWSQPGEFTVKTPSAIAVDLGCAYTLQVDDAGAGLLRTNLGWVGFKHEGREAFIPAGAVCGTRPKVGPGTPYFEDASEQFRDALSKFDFSSGTPAQRSEEISQLLDSSRQRDALTIWHLLSRVDESERGRVYDRLATLVPPPPGVTREGILRLDQSMLDLWWNRLGLGDVSLWRTWERSWSPKKI